ncbi:MAG: hypothetical protein FWE94_00015 [Coriobacteriia bacterium]|nr:hypothetical protein [Coriobacteriia bacterium]
MRYVLQNRWKLEDGQLIYYGIRKKPYLNKNTIRLTKKEIAFFRDLINGTCDTQSELFEAYVGQGIIVPEDKYVKTPGTLDDATFCKSCIANNYIIPGIEFDEEGLCPICADTEKHLVSILPIQNVFQQSKNRAGRFDVALFYTGGKDSTYLLYYLSKKLNLRVVALTWELPYMSDNARQSIENAHRLFPNVEFVSRRIADADLKPMFRKLLELQNNTCACTSIAHAIFYSLLCEERVPYVVLANEPAQMKALYYNRIVPKMAYTARDNKALDFLMNVGRLLLLKKPLKSGQREMLMLVRQLAYGDGLIKRLSGSKNQLVSNVCLSMDYIPNLKQNLKRAIRQSDRRALMPAFVHVDLNDISESDTYDYESVKEFLTAECGFVMPQSKHKILHTSCAVEAAKDYSQFKRFYDMESQIMPYSALELIIASTNNNIERDAAMEEIRHGLVLEQPHEHKVMQDYSNS